MNLFTLIENEDVVGIEKIVAAGASVNMEDISDYGRVPLAFAIQKGYLSVVEILIKAGADPNVPLKGSSPPPHIIISKGWPTHIVSSLVEAGASVDALDKFGRTPLELSYEYGQPEAAAVLLLHGADAFAKNRLGKSFIGIADPLFIERTLSGLGESREAVVARLLIISGGEFASIIK